MKQIKSDMYRIFVESDSNESILLNLRRYLNAQYGSYSYAPIFQPIILSVIVLCKSIADDKYYGE